MQMPSLALRTNLLLTDLGFIAYWCISYLGVLPKEWLFKDYQNPILISWNWSFAPLDLLASAIGLFSLVAAKKGFTNWRPVALVSLSLTFCAGFMALSFWTLQKDFDPWWWLPNLYLMVWPMLLGKQLFKLH